MGTIGGYTCHPQNIPWLLNFVVVGDNLNMSRMRGKRLMESYVGWGGDLCVLQSQLPGHIWYRRSSLASASMAIKRMSKGDRS